MGLFLGASVLAGLSGGNDLLAWRPMPELMALLHISRRCSQGIVVRLFDRADHTAVQATGWDFGTKN